MRARLLDRRVLQVTTLTLVLLVVFVLLTLDTLNQRAETVGVWVMTRSVTAGATVDAGSVRPGKLSAAGETGGYMTSSPVGKLVQHALSEGDVVRTDDIASSTMVTVPVKLSGFQPSAGDLIDVYVVESGKATLIGRGVPFVGGGMEVPASDEPLWVALYGSSSSLIATRSAGAGVPGSDPVAVGDAVRQLAAIAAGIGR